MRLRRSRKRSGETQSVNEDVREILEGRGDGQLKRETGPEIYPGMEDRGIGSVREAAPGERGTHRRSRTEDGTGRRRAEAENERYRRTPERGERFGEPDRAAYREAPGYPSQESGSRTPGKRRRSKGPYLFISAAFVILFLLLIGYLVYFNVSLKDDVINSPYNKRQNSMADRVLRGKIEALDGSVLAYTQTDDEGSETRVYPYANEYAHVVGFVTHGKSGLESAANYDLLTSHGNLIDQILDDFQGRKTKGDNVVTTLNTTLQDVCYSALGDYSGAVIVMDPKTGAVKAMVSKPDFDPNTLDSRYADMVADSSNSQLVNRATQGLYPPGSTFKILTSLAYYRRYHTFDSFSYTCTGELQVDDYTVHCYHGTAHGEENFTQAFAHSCNTAFSTIGLDLGANPLTKVAKDMLFGQKLPFDLASSKSRWSLTSSSGRVELVQTAFGQGKTLVTPYHMALIVSAIANDGVLMKPYLIDHIENAAGSAVSKTKPKTYRRLMTSDEASKLTDLMKAVVSEGSASALSGRSYQAAGKTGSAEYYRSDGSIGTHSWFVGFTNPGNPDLVIAVLAENGGSGSSTAVPIAEKVLDTYYGG